MEEAPKHPQWEATNLLIISPAQAFDLHYMCHRCNHCLLILISMAVYYNCLPSINALYYNFSKSRGTTVSLSTQGVMHRVVWHRLWQALHQAGIQVESLVPTSTLFPGHLRILRVCLRHQPYPVIPICQTNLKPKFGPGNTLILPHHYIILPPQRYSVSVRPGDDNETPVFCVAPRARSKIVFFDQWLQGLKIYVHFFLKPQHISESQNILMYIQTVRLFYEKGADWRLYDEAFR